MQKNEKNIEKKIEKVRMILDDPSCTDAALKHDRHLSALQKRLKQSSFIQTSFPSKAADQGEFSPRVIVFSKERERHHQRKDIAEVEKVTEEIEEVFKEEPLFVIEKKEIEDIPEFVEVKPQEKTLEKQPRRKQFTFADEDLEKLPKWEPVSPEKLEDKRETHEKVTPQKKKESEVKTQTPEKIKTSVSPDEPEEKTQSTKKKKMSDASIWEPIEEQKSEKEKQKTPLDSAPGKNGRKEKEPKKVGTPEKKKGKSSGKKEAQICHYKGYTLYKKEIPITPDIKRTVHFFSKETPDEGVPISLPEGYEIKINKGTGVPFIRKKKTR